MQWQVDLLWFVGGAGVVLSAASLVLQEVWRRRYRAMKKEANRMSEDLGQMIDLQMELFRRLSQDLTGIEEKVMDLSVPSSDAPPPLERRHQVLTLARKGIALEEIAHRLNIPKGEAELIMNLRKYMEPPPTDVQQGVIKGYARASS